MALPSDEIIRFEDKGVFPTIWQESGHTTSNYDITMFTDKLHNDVTRILTRILIMISEAKTVYKSHHWPLSLSSNEYSVQAITLNCLYFKLQC